MIRKCSSLLVALAAIALSAPSFAAKRAENKSVKVPEPISEFVSSTFGSNVKILNAARQNEYGTYHYDVKLSNGAQVDFDAGQNWVEINCEEAAASVPSAVLHKEIHSHISSNYPRKQVRKIERKYNGYEITLTNGVEVYYNKDGQFVRED